MKTEYNIYLNLLQVLVKYIFLKVFYLYYICFIPNTFKKYLPTSVNRIYTMILFKAEH